MYVVNVYTVPVRRLEFITREMAERVAEHYERQAVDAVIAWKDDDYTTVEKYVYPLT